MVGHGPFKKYNIYNGLKLRPVYFHIKENCWRWPKIQRPSPNPAAVGVMQKLVISMARGREAEEREEKLIITEDHPGSRDIIVIMILITSKRTQIETVSNNSPGEHSQHELWSCPTHCPQFFLCYNSKSFQIPWMYFSFTLLVLLCFWFYLTPEVSWRRPPAGFHKPNIMVCPGGRCFGQCRPREPQETQCTPRGLQSKVEEDSYSTNSHSYGNTTLPIFCVLKISNDLTRDQKLCSLLRIANGLQHHH